MGDLISPDQTDSLEPIDFDPDKLDLEVHEGSHDLPAITRQLPDQDGLKSFKVRFEDAIENLSVNKYESEASMIREYISNMVATCLEAEEKLGEDYDPVIHIAYYPDSKTLIMEDNGMGMSSEEIEYIGTRIGVGTNRFNPDRPGKFGIGILSGFKGVGLDGAFFMHSRSRRTDEYLKGLWIAHGFKPFERLPDKLDPGQYGTRFEFPLKQPEVDVREEVHKLSFWSRIPILYTERDSEGNVIEDDEFGNRSETPFLDLYEDPDGSFIYETDAFRAVHNPDSKNATVLLDVPIDRNVSFGHTNIDTRHLPFRRQIDVLFKSEDQEIVDGPHKGLTRVGDGEYQTLDEDKKDQFIPVSNCSPDDVWIPSPAGDRDRLQQNTEFWEWLVEKITTSFAERICEIVTEKATDADNISELPREDLHLISTWMTHDTHQDDWNINQFRRSVRNLGRNTGLSELVEITERSRDDEEDDDGDDFQEVMELFRGLGLKVELCERWSNPWSVHSRSRDHVYRLLIDVPDDADVYMATHPSEKKAEVVWDDHPDNQVVRVDKLKTFEKAFGWKRLNYIDEDTVHEFDVSEEILDNFRNDYEYNNPNAGKDAPARQITLHRAQWGSGKTPYKDKTTKPKVRKIRIVAEAAQSGKEINVEEFPYGFERLILFPTNSDEKLTDYIGTLGYDGEYLANCAVKVWNHLRDLDNVVRIEDILDTAESIELPSSHGILSIPEARSIGKNVMIHLVKEDVLPGIQDRPEMKEAAKWFREKSRRRGTIVLSNGGRRRSTFEDPVYIPVVKETLDRIRPMLRFDDVHLVTHETNYNLPKELRINQPSFDTEIYAYANLYNWRHTQEFDILSKQSEKLSNGMMGVIDGFATLHDAGLPVPSEQDPDESKLITALSDESWN